MLAFAVACVILSGGFASTWPDAKVQAVTQFMQQYRSDWTVADTMKMSQGKIPHTQASVFVNNQPLDLKLEADGGRLIPISVIGESILVDGKDISGNLGSKTTTGTNSPIIEDVSGSQITTGNSSPISHQSNFTISISLSLALSISLVANLYFLKRMKERKSPEKKNSDAAP